MIRFINKFQYLSSCYVSKIMYKSMQQGNFTLSKVLTRYNHCTAFPLGEPDPQLN